MGYSCSAKASFVEQKIADYCFKSTGSNNVWINGSEKYFYEIGREQPDHAIVGKVVKFLPNNYCIKAGSFRIEPDGTIARFTGLPKTLWKEFENHGRSLVNTPFGIYELAT